MRTGSFVVDGMTDNPRFSSFSIQNSKFTIPNLSTKLIGSASRSNDGADDNDKDNDDVDDVDEKITIECSSFESENPLFSVLMQFTHVPLVSAVHKYASFEASVRLLFSNIGVEHHL